MKEQLLELLGLDAKASDAEIIAAVKALKSAGPSAEEKEIRDLVVASGHSLTREGAAQVIADRQAAAKKTAKK